MYPELKKKSNSNYSSLQTGCLGFLISVHETVFILLPIQILVDRIHRVYTTVCSMYIVNSEILQ